MVARETCATDGPARGVHSPWTLWLVGSGIGAVVVLCVVPPPTGITAEVLRPAVLTVFVITCWATGVLPEHVTALAFFGLAMLFSLAPPEVVFSGFLSASLWLVLSGLIVGVAIIRTGLGAWVAQSVLGWFGTSYVQPRERAGGRGDDADLRHAVYHRTHTALDPAGRGACRAAGLRRRAPRAGRARHGRGDRHVHARGGHPPGQHPEPGPGWRLGNPLRPHLPLRQLSPLAPPGDGCVESHGYGPGHLSPVSRHHAAARARARSAAADARPAECLLRSYWSPSGSG